MRRTSVGIPQQAGGLLVAFISPAIQVPKDVLGWSNLKVSGPRVHDWRADNRVDKPDNIIVPDEGKKLRFELI